MWPGDPFWLVVIGASRVDAGLWRRRGWQDGSVCRAAISEPGDLAALGQALESLAGHCKALGEASAKTARGGRCRVRILLADAWIDGTTLPWNPRALSGGALAAHARNTLIAAGVEMADDDVVRIGDAPYRQPRWAIAYPAPLLQALGEFAGALDAVLESVAPLGIAAVHALGKLPSGCALLALADENELSLWHCPNGAPRLLAASPSGERPENALDLLWRRARLRDPRLEHIDKVAILDLAGKGVERAWETPRHVPVDLPGMAAAEATGPLLQIAAQCCDRVFELDARQRYPRLNIRMIAAASLWLGIAATVLFQAVRTTGAEADAKHKLEARTAAAAPKPAPTWSKGDVQRIQAVNVAIRELNLPVSALLQAVQPPKDIRVALLGVEFAPGRGNDDTPLLKLTAESRTGEEMARYAGFLAGRRPLVDAYLVSHEVAETDPLKPYRFSVEAKWRE